MVDLGRLIGTNISISDSNEFLRVTFFKYRHYVDKGRQDKTDNDVIRLDKRWVRDSQNGSNFWTTSTCKIFIYFCCINIMVRLFLGTTFYERWSARDILSGIKISIFDFNGSFLLEQFTKRLYVGRRENEQNLIEHVDKRRMPWLSKSSKTHLMESISYQRAHLPRLKTIKKTTFVKYLLIELFS